MTLIRFYPYQQRWLDDDSRFKIGMFARQTGKTFTMAAEIVRDMVNAYVHKKSCRWLIVSRAERQASEIMRSAVKPMMKAVMTLVSRNSKTTPAISYRALEISLCDNVRVSALPANPDTIRGFSGNVFLDEFAFHRNERAIWAAIFPTISRPGLKLRVMSTPNGQGNIFFELMTKKQETRWSRHCVDIYQAVSEGLPRNLCELQSAINDPQRWQQEYALQWQDDVSSWLNREHVLACEEQNRTATATAPVVIGIDIAVRNHLYVAWILACDNGLLITKDVICKRQLSFVGQETLLAGLVNRWKPRAIWVDQTGLGEAPVENAKRRYGSLITGVHFTARRKLALATLLRQAVTDRVLRLPAGDSAIRDDLTAVKQHINIDGSVRLYARPDKGGHADRFWAAALAVAAAGIQQNPPIFYRAAANRNLLYV